MTKFLIPLAGLALLAGAQTAPASLADEDLVTISSPDGRIVFRLFNGPPLNEAFLLPNLAYEVDFGGKRLIETSYLGFELYSQVPLGEKLGLVKATRTSVDESYTLPAGKARTVRNRYNGAVAEYLQNGTTGRQMTVEVRAFNEGVAFRYWVPPSPLLPEMQIENEITQFLFAQDADAYALLLDGFDTPYEDQFTRIPLSGIHPESVIGLPLLVEQPGVGWAAILEADLDEYAGLYLQHAGGPLLRARLAPRADGSTLAVRMPTPVASPWRVILIAEEAHKLLESHIPASLNAASAIADTSWIRPGKAIRTAAEAGAITEAVEAGLEYVVIEDGWAAAGDRGAVDITKARAGFDLPAILAGAEQRNVGIWLTAPWTAVDAQMDAAFALYEQWGVRGVRISGPSRDNQYGVDFYRRTARAAAAHKLMLDFEDSYKPDGSERTWPNVLTREAALGSEYAPEGARANPGHNVMLAFTRLLAGSMSYAPGVFSTAAAGTRAHQLALAVIFESPLQVLAEPAAVYRGQPEFEFLRAVPATWDETRALSGVVGEHVAVARRSGGEWYVGAITNRDAREIGLPLSFLGPGEYTAEIYGDGGITRQTVTASTQLQLELAAGGGAAIRFHKN